MGASPYCKEAPAFGNQLGPDLAPDQPNPEFLGSVLLLLDLGRRNLVSFIPMCQTSRGTLVISWNQEAAEGNLWGVQNPS